MAANDLENILTDFEAISNKLGKILVQSCFSSFSKYTPFLENYLIIHHDSKKRYSYEKRVYTCIQNL